MTALFLPTVWGTNLGRAPLLERDNFILLRVTVLYTNIWRGKLIKVPSQNNRIKGIVRGHSFTLVNFIAHSS